MQHSVAYFEEAQMAKSSEGRSDSSVFGVFSDLEADWQFRRTLEHMGEQSAEIGEALFAAKRTPAAFDLAPGDAGICDARCRHCDWRADRHQSD